MAPTCMSTALLLGSFFSFSSRGAACLSAICFISAIVGIRPRANRPAWGLAEATLAADWGCLTALFVVSLALGGCPLPITLPTEVAGPEVRATFVGDIGDCDARKKYPIASPATR